MDQINAIIHCQPGNLARPTAKLTARQGASFVLGAKNVPDDVTQVYLRIFRPDGAYYDIPGNAHAAGRTFYAIGTCFPDVGSARWELHATDARGNPTALAFGPLEVLPFSAGGDPVTPGETVTVCQIPTADGAMVQVRMVLDETGHWTYQAVVGD